ncbi:triose-phosphate isomerase [Candidatus Micrarchaeota archaeon RBG_16_36_9]|nr:MAG: triose-phosphate isomerase [Candidatus Micrarchaeota archaeon RBG_16_36_9]
MTLHTPLLIVNLKEYDEVLGDRPVTIAKVARKLFDKYKINILIAPPDPMIDNISKIVLTVSQHIEPYEPGAHTGALLAKEVKELGAVGSIINHSEKRMPAEDVKKCIDLCREYDLVSIVCAQNSKEAGELAKFNPDFIAIEPPELIGGDISVSTAEPEIITNSVNEVKRNSLRTNVLCGAGVKTREDVKKAIELGAKGILVASGVVKSSNIEKSIEELVKGMR